MPFETQTHSSRGQILRRGPNLGGPAHRGHSEQQGAQSHGISLQMLGIAAIASAVAAAVTRMLWPGATIVSAAMTPVIVAFVKEALWHPAERIKTGIGQLSDATTTPLRGRAVSSEKSTRLARLEALETHGELPPYRRVYGRRRLRIKPVLIIGAVGFVLAAAALTLPELVLGGALVGGGSSTFFGSSTQQASHPAPVSQPGRASGPGTSRGSAQSLQSPNPAAPPTYGRDLQGRQSQPQGAGSYGSPGGQGYGGQSAPQNSPSGGSDGGSSTLPNPPQLPLP